MAITMAPFPLRTSVTLEATRILTRPWVAWFTELVQKVDSDPTVVSSVSLTAKSASLTTTTFTRAIAAAGVYRIGHFARITTAATTSSSLTVTMGVVNGGVTCALPAAAMTGNTTSTVQSGTTYVQADVSTPITYTTTYASSGGTAMVYSLWMTVERVQT